MTEFSYVHIPFCRSKCRYCAFVSFVNLNFIDKYIEALLIEIEKKYKNEPQKTLYFGGGTPSLLSIAQVKKIISRFNFKKNPEITFEVNPESVDYDYLKALFDMGINRLSIGIQTFDDENLGYIGRFHNSKDSFLAIENAKKAGFKNVSIDLIYGLINQDIKKWKKDLETVKNLDIEHISTYGLKIEEKTYFSKFPPENLPDEETQALMYEVLTDELKNFYHYEISNFAKNENFVSKHNLNYWTLKPYYGFGPSASGFLNDIRYKNTDNMKEYLKNPVSEIEKKKLTKEEKLEEMIFLGFRKLKGIETDKINKEFNIDFENKYNKILKKYQESGHILKTEKGYKLTRNGVLISNYILSDFLN